MPIEKIDIDHFLNLSKQLPILDVRSPAEFNHAHIPHAFSVPIFTDEQRAIIGTAYVRQSRQTAVDHGLNYFSERMKTIPAEAIQIVNEWQNNEEIGTSHSVGNGGFLIHCWRGGMRSEAVAWLLSLYGYRIYLLKGGYKAYRRWTLAQFEKKYSLKVLGGFTGSGKTEVLKELRRSGKRVIDLELLANHKGSAFGALGENPQPTHEMFENLLGIELWKEANNGSEETEIWVEDESVHVGKVGIPKPFWEQMRQSPIFFMDIPFDERLSYITETYGVFDKEQVTECILRIQKRLGGLNTKNAIQLLSENKTRESFAILLAYYDKFYESGLHKRENIFSLLNKVTCTNVSVANAKKLNNP
ncbi:MAG TPA: tRNA 2-selenouridine(34) synthase MnmH [Hanamia sp.]